MLSCPCGEDHARKQCARCPTVKFWCEMSHKGAYCKPCASEYSRTWRNARNYDQEWQRVRRLRSKGISQQQYDQMFAAQSHGCAVCGTTDQPRWAVDHDHECCPGMNSCGRCVRGILCFPCNMAIGSFKESAALLLKASQYLEAHRALA